MADDAQTYVIKTDGGDFKIIADKGMPQDKVLTLAAATNPKFALYHAQAQATGQLAKGIPDKSPRKGGGTLGPAGALVPTSETLPAAGMLAGGMLGSTGGPGGSVAGATLGGMAGVQAKRLMRGQPTMSKEAGMETAVGGATGATTEMGGQTAGKVISKGVETIAPMVSKGISKLAGIPGAIAKEEEAAAATQAANVSKFRETEQATKEAQQVAKERNISTYREAEQHLAAKQEEVAAANKAEREAYLAEKKVATEEVEKQKIIAARRTNLVKSADQIKPVIQKHLHDVQDAVFDDLNQRWDALRQRIGPNIRVNPNSIATAMQQANLNVTAANRELFTKVIDDAFGGAKPTNLTWTEAQAIYTKLGNRLAQGGLPGDVWRGLSSFQDMVGTEMETMANAAGVRADFQSVKSAWSTAMSDLKDTHKSVANGGSPIAHALAKADPDGVVKYFEGKLTGPANRALKILARYKGYGADVGYPMRYRSILEEEANLPKPKAVTMPTEPTPHPTPQMTEAPYMPGPPDPTAAEYKTYPVDKEAIRKAQMSKLKTRAATIGGVGLAYEIIHKLFGGSSAPAPH